MSMITEPISYTVTNSLKPVKGQPQTSQKTCRPKRLCRKLAEKRCHLSNKSRTRTRETLFEEEERSYENSWQILHSTNESDIMEDEPKQLEIKLVHLKTGDTMCEFEAELTDRIQFNKADFPLNQVLEPPFSNIQEIMYIRRRRGLSVICPIFMSIRKQFVVYVKEKVQMLRLSREACQLVFYYMDEYYSRCSYKQEQALLNFSCFFLIASKLIESHRIKAEKVALDIKVPLQKLCARENSIALTLQFLLCPETYISSVGQAIQTISSLAGRQFFGQDLDSYLLVRKIYYICDQVYWKMQRMNAGILKTIFREVFRSCFDYPELQRIIETAFRGIQQKQSLIQGINEAVNSFEMKKQQIQQCFLNRNRSIPYSIFVGLYS